MVFLVPLFKIYSNRKVKWPLPYKKIRNLLICGVAKSFKHLIPFRIFKISLSNFHHGIIKILFINENATCRHYECGTLDKKGLILSYEPLKTGKAGKDVTSPSISISLKTYEYIQVVMCLTHLLHQILL